MSEETFIPELESVFYNFMDASQMIFGPSKKGFCIAYSEHQEDFNVYTRKYHHNFKVSISDENLEGAVGANLNTSQMYIIADEREVAIYGMDDY
jgi:hypothetical protein